VLAVLLVAGAAPVAAHAGDPPRTPPRPAPASTARPAADTDLELLEFLGSDDGDPELQQYLASRDAAVPHPTSATNGRSTK
jgi:hypothetical protein